MHSIKTKPGLRRFIPTPLKPLAPVPADIDIAQAATLKPISQVADDEGICFLCSLLQAAVALKTNTLPAVRQEGFYAQSGCRDLNPGPLAPQTSTLTGLSYIPCCKAVQN